MARSLQTIKAEVLPFNLVVGSSKLVKNWPQKLAKIDATSNFEIDLDKFDNIMKVFKNTHFATFGI